MGIQVKEAPMATVTVKTHIANWFEIPVKDLDRAATFYEKVFDVKLTREDMGGMKLAMFPFTQNAPGAPGALIQGESYEPSHAGTVVYFSVEDIPETLRRINVNGGKTLMPKTAIGQYGFIAQYEDPEGNRLALHSMK
jgi:predicted enzyme related to lactoylglutathione lyase